MDVILFLIFLITKSCTYYSALVYLAQLSKVNDISQNIFFIFGNLIFQKYITSKTILPLFIFSINEISILKSKFSLIYDY